MDEHTEAKQKTTYVSVPRSSGELAVVSIDPGEVSYTAISFDMRMNLSI